jgi:hypothetical protein
MMRREEWSMDIVVYIAVYVIAIVISTGLLGASLYVIENNRESSFQLEGRAVTWGKCAGLILVVTLLRLIPFGPLIGLVVFFVGVMMLFQKSFGQTFMLLLVNGAFSFVITRGAMAILSLMGSSG